ncbi:DUF3667 domain-containing protein [Inhella sp.]|uniref:DUF3667 domain-containing protein n=1 Tax=Inhella sp. TaxID=1921806 RepID=UPI0035AE7D5D
MTSTSLSHCRNCGQRLNPWDKFCSQCGQDTLDHPPSLWEFVHEWLLHYVAAEGKLWKSLWALLAKPGFLTQEYLQGRKQRYVLPLRLLLTFGLLFFLSLKLLPSPVEVEAPAQPTPEVAAAAASQAEARLAESSLPAPAASAIAAGVRQSMRAGMQGQGWQQAPVVMDAEDREKLPSALRVPLERLEKRFAENRDAAWLQLKSTMLSLAPYAVLISLPFFAGLLKLLYPGTVYGAHFLMAMHLHAAWYLMLLLVVLLQGFSGLLFALWAWSNVYPLLALKRVNGSGWPSTLARGAVLAVLHWILIGVVFIGLAAAGVAAV